MTANIFFFLVFVTRYADKRVRTGFFRSWFAIVLRTLGIAMAGNEARLATRLGVATKRAEPLPAHATGGLYEPRRPACQGMQPLQMLRFFGHPSREISPSLP
jgi:hypothetical protein